MIQIGLKFIFIPNASFRNTIGPRADAYVGIADDVVEMNHGAITAATYSVQVDKVVTINPTSFSTILGGTTETFQLLGQWYHHPRLWREDKMGLRQLRHGLRQEVVPRRFVSPRLQPSTAEHQIGRVWRDLCRHSRWSCSDIMRRK